MYTVEKPITDKFNFRQLEPGCIYRDDQGIDYLIVHDTDEIYDAPHFAVSLNGDEPFNMHGEHLFSRAVKPFTLIGALVKK